MNSFVYDYNIQYQEKRNTMKNELLLLDNQLCFRLYSVSRKMTKAYQPHLEKYGLTYPQYIVMLAIFEVEAIDFKELSSKVNLTTGTMTPIINRLEKLEYINKEPNPDDNRRVNIVLSEAGKKLYEDIIDVPSGLSQRLQVSIEMYATLIEQLDELNDILDQLEEPHS